MMNPNVGCRWREDEEGDKEGGRKGREGGMEEGGMEEQMQCYVAK